MSGFGGGFGGGAFGANNNTQQSTGFGFGATPAANTGFGSTPATTGFGASNTTGGGLFGGNTGGFGNSGGAFGSTTGGFGAAKPAFGAPTTSTAGSIFGGATTATTGSGFGAFGQPQAATTGFGAPAASTGGLFGAKPASSFGAATSNPFGGGTSTGFGAAPATNAFGAPASTALGGVTGTCEGTASTPFQPFVEKEPNSSNNQQNSFQNICFQQPYQKWSPDELRLADYTGGRRYGNGSNQAGAFGTNTGFGGFGASNTTSTGFGSANSGSTLFGSAATTSSPFGSTQPAATGFGANTATAGGGLFGAAKPANTMFGGTPAQPTSNLFGANNTTNAFGSPPAAGGFGSNNAAPTSLFGAAATANKPASGFSFGNTNTQLASTSAFGSAPATGFGAATGGLFGANNNTQTQNTSSPFGQQQPAANTGFGAFGGTQAPAAGSSIFGAQNQQKPAGGLFGAPSTTAPSGGLFGQPAQQPAATGGLFGNAAAQPQQNSLFGGVAKPAGSSFFGAPANNTQTNTGSNLFGAFGAQNQNTNQQQNSGGLFGNFGANNNQDKPSLFGNTQNQNSAGSSLFGNNASQPQQGGGGLFGGLGLGNSQNQQQAQNPFGNSLFSNSQQNQQNSQSLTASISDNAAYGGGSLFGSLANTTTNNPGPIATPLSSSVKRKSTTALPMYKLNTASSSRFSTPQKRPGGFGFSYSQYGTPGGSPGSSSSTPGGSVFGTFGRSSLRNSVSSNGLRRTFGPEDSILAPGAFSASSNSRPYGSTGSVKKLNINRNIRNDLFTPPTAQQSPAAPSTGILKNKRVSFENTTNGVGVSSPLKHITNGSSPSSEELGLLRPSNPSANGTNGKSPLSSRADSPEMEQVSNNQLSVVNEDLASPSKPIPQVDQEPGRYYMKPTKEEILALPRAAQKAVKDFTVGREGIGHVTFLPPVDLTRFNLDEIPGGIVVLTMRSCTVYYDASKKPPMGQGLNVPAVISLQNSWPRKRDGKTPSTEKSGALFKKHVDRLTRVPDTTYRSYDKDTGIWSFSVEHFTTYGFPEDEDEEGEETEGEGLSELEQTALMAEDTPTPRNSRTHLDQSFASTSQATNTESDPEDTFDFKRRKVLPGAFDNQEAYIDDESMEEDDDETYEESFLDERSVGSQSETGVEEPMDQDDEFQDEESVSIRDQEMAGSYPEVDNTAELDEGDSQDDYDNMGGENNALVRARLRASHKAATPMKKFAAGNDWTDALVRTVSPKKQDRAMLKSLIQFQDDSRSELPSSPTKGVATDTRGFATSIDLMNSLFGQPRSPIKPAKVPAKAKGFEWPYAKRPKTSDSDMKDMTAVDRQFYESFKPSWGPDGTLVYSSQIDPMALNKSPSRRHENNGLLAVQRGAIVSEGRDVRFAKVSNENSAEHLQIQQGLTKIGTSDNVPYAELPEKFLLSAFCDQRATRDPAANHEKLVWELASILWDPIVVPEELEGIPSIEERLRKDKLSSFWQRLVSPAANRTIPLAKSHEEKAIASLSAHNVPDACAHLIAGKNFHLATLISVIGTKESIRKDIKQQISDWKQSKVLSEFSQPVRTLYELLAGNVCICDGTDKVPGEDRIDSFIISKRFGLDWRQAFGFRLWYGTLPTEPIESAIESFATDLNSTKETAKPHPWYVEEKVPTLWEDKDQGERDDLLWGLLKLHTFHNVSIDDVLLPANSQLSPLNFRLTWQLSQALTAANVVTLVDESKPDEITLSFAAQLTSEGSWLDAVFVLLHLSDPNVRTKSIQKHLSQFAGRIGSEESQSFITLTTQLQIPATWIWEAKALYMRSVERDPRAEVECLIKAGSFNEAHRTFAREVAPKCIVELDYDVLRMLLDGFRGVEQTISEWPVGGEVYLDFLQIVGQNLPDILQISILDRLVKSLPRVVQIESRPSFMERVAVETISATVAKKLVALGKRGQRVDLPKVLDLPLTEDQYLNHTVDLSIQYYRSIFAK